MKRLRLGLYPLSQDLTHPGDRRRVVSWARSRGHELCINEYKRVDLIFISEGSDFLKISKYKGPPKVFDLIDGYLNPESVFIDWLRGISKVVIGQHQTFIRRYSSMVKQACRNVDLVVCSSEEQQLEISQYNPNVHNILDNHSEFPFLKFRVDSAQRRTNLFWEGTTFTLKGVEQLMRHIMLEGLTLNLVTDPVHPLFLGKYYQQDVLSRLNKRLCGFEYTLKPWSVENVVLLAKQSHISIIPLDLMNSLQFMKPENRLLIMFRIGLPSLTSSLPSYKRVENALGVKITCESYDDWTSSIKTFLQNQDMCEYQVNQGQKYILDTHTEEILFEKWDKAIESLL